MLSRWVAAAFRGYRPLGLWFWMAFFLLAALAGWKGSGPFLALRDQQWPPPTASNKPAQPANPPRRRVQPPARQNEPARQAPSQPASPSPEEEGWDRLPRGFYINYYSDRDFAQEYGAQYRPHGLRMDVAAPEADQAPVSARITARLQVPATGWWRFYVEAGDGANLWINERLAYEGLKRESAVGATAPVMLRKGWVPIAVDWWRSGAEAGELSVWWEGPGQERQIVPMERLRADPGLRRLPRP